MRSLGKQDAENPDDGGRTDPRMNNKPEERPYPSKVLGGGGGFSFDVSAGEKKNKSGRQSLGKIKPWFGLLFFTSV